MASIDLSTLPTFVAVAETMSFSAAAKRLGVPKSTVSRGVAAMEERLGVRLFHRTTRQVSLSTAGRALYERVATTLADLQRSLTEIPELGEEPSGKLRVTTSIDVGATIMPELVAAFTARFPLVEVELHVTNALVDLVSAGFDVALRITATKLKDSSLAAQLVGRASMGVYASPQYLAKHGTPRTVDDLSGQTWVRFRDAASLTLQSEGASHTVTIRGPLRCDDMIFAREVTKMGLGLALLPTFVAAADVHAGLLVRVVPRWSTPSGGLWVVAPGAAHLPRKVIEFRRFVLDFFAARRMLADEPT